MEVKHESAQGGGRSICMTVIAAVCVTAPRAHNVRRNAWSLGKVQHTSAQPAPDQTYLAMMLRWCRVDQFPELRLLSMPDALANIALDSQLYIFPMM
jgi:hypothetical protein